MAVKATPLEDFGYLKASSTMRRLIQDWSNRPEVIQKAIEIIRPVRGGDYVNEAKEIFRYVRDKIRYTSDVSNEDIYRDPMLTMELKAGDCNNKVLLGCSLAKAVGFPCRMVFVFDGEGNFPAHVFYQVDITKGEADLPRWTDQETIPVPSANPGSVLGPDRLLEFGQSMPQGQREYVEVDR